MLPIAAEIATRLTREHAQSARPDAPVIPEADARSAAGSWASLVPDVVDSARAPTAARKQRETSRPRAWLHRWTVGAGLGRAESPRER